VSIEKPNLTGEARAEAALSLVRQCTPADSAALAEIYFKALPMAHAPDLQADLAEDAAALPSFVVEDADGAIEMALLGSRTGALFLADPDAQFTDEKEWHFTILTEAMWRSNAPRLTCGLPIAIPSRLQHFGKLLEQGGLVTREVFQIRIVHFSGPTVERAS
jgi:hypothetical protein